MAWHDWVNPLKSKISPLTYVSKGAGYARQYGGESIDKTFSKKADGLIPENPYQGQWDSLIAQLTKQASGQGPSLAGNAFRQASAAGMKQQQAMAAGGSAGRARQAGMNMGQINQAQAFGYSNARLQEQLAARSQLQGALSGAGQAWFGPQQANQALLANQKSLWEKMAPYVTTAATLMGGPGAGAAVGMGMNYAGGQQQQQAPLYNGPPGMYTTGNQTWY